MKIKVNAMSGSGGLNEDGIKYKHIYTSTLCSHLERQTQTDRQTYRDRLDRIKVHNVIASLKDHFVQCVSIKVKFKTT